jgi:hypothetical protein
LSLYINQSIVVVQVRAASLMRLTDLELAVRW